MDYRLWIEYGLWIMDWIWIGFGFNILELNGYGLVLELELSPSGTSAYSNLCPYHLCHLWHKWYNLKQWP